VSEKVFGASAEEPEKPENRPKEHLLTFVFRSDRAPDINLATFQVPSSGNFLLPRSGTPTSGPGARLIHPERLSSVENYRSAQTPIEGSDMIRRSRPTRATYEALVVAPILPCRSRRQQWKVSTRHIKALKYSVKFCARWVGSDITRLYKDVTVGK
jgi:hypothetical protein